jgi:hypothetical protein
MNTCRPFASSLLAISFVFAAGCFGPSLERVRDSSGHEFTLGSAVETVQAIKGCTFGEFKVAGADRDGIILEDHRKGNKPAVYTKVRVNDSDAENWTFSSKGCSGKEWAAAAGIMALMSLSKAGDNPYVQTISASDTYDVIQFPWRLADHVRIVFPVANVLAAFSLAFLVLPAFYVLDICDAEGDVLLSFVPDGQFSHNFLLGASGSNLGHCRKIAAAMLFLRDRKD